MGLRGGRGQGGKGSDGRGRGLLGPLLSWQEGGGGGWLRHPIASPPVPWKITVGLPEMKTQPWTQTLDTRKMLVTILDLSCCTSVRVLWFFLGRAILALRINVEHILNFACHFWPCVVLLTRHGGMSFHICDDAILVRLGGFTPVHRWLWYRPCGIHARVAQVTFSLRRSVRRLINDKECYLQFRLRLIWVSLGGWCAPFTECGCKYRLASSPLYASSNYILEMPTSQLPTSPPWEVRSRLLRHIISEASCEWVQKTLKSVWVSGS